MQPLERRILPDANRAISTYGGQGALKHGCDPSEHAIVHLDNANPVWLAGEYERGMTKEPISIRPSVQGETMDPTSRVRCGKIYSIEWNVKLRDIGMVVAHDKTKLMRYFEEGQEKGFDHDDDELGSQAQYFQPMAMGYPQQQNHTYYGY